MLHIAGGIILAKLFFILLPVLWLAGRALLRLLFIAIAWALASSAGFYLLFHIPFAIDDVFSGKSTPAERAWLWVFFAAIGTIVIVRKALNTPVYRHP